MVLFWPIYPAEETILDCFSSERWGWEGATPDNNLKGKQQVRCQVWWGEMAASELWVEGGFHGDAGAFLTLIQQCVNQFNSTSLTKPLGEGRQRQRCQKFYNSYIFSEEFMFSLCGIRAQIPHKRLQGICWAEQLFWSIATGRWWYFERFICWGWCKEHFLKHVGWIVPSGTIRVCSPCPYCCQKLHKLFLQRKKSLLPVWQGQESRERLEDMFFCLQIPQIRISTSATLTVHTHMRFSAGKWWLKPH